MTTANGAELVKVGYSTAASGSVQLEITVQDGWYLFAPGSDEGLPLRVTTGGAEVPVLVEGANGKLAGRFVLSLDAPVDDVLQLHLQACNGDQCLRPAVLPVRVHAS